MKGKTFARGTAQPQEGVVQLRHVLQSVDVIQQMGEYDLDDVSSLAQTGDPAVVKEMDKQREIKSVRAYETFIATDTVQAEISFVIVEVALGSSLLGRSDAMLLGMRQAMPDKRKFVRWFRLASVLLRRSLQVEDSSVCGRVLCDVAFADQVWLQLEDLNGHCAMPAPLQ